MTYTEGRIANARRAVREQTIRLKFLIRDRDRGEAGLESDIEVTAQRLKAAQMHETEAVLDARAGIAGGAWITMSDAERASVKGD